MNEPHLPESMWLNRKNYHEWEKSTKHMHSLMTTQFNLSFMAAKIAKEQNHG